MALDEPSDDDHKVEKDGITLVADRDLLDRFGGVNVDFKVHPWGGGGFVVRPSHSPPSACGDCGC